MGASAWRVLGAPFHSAARIRRLVTDGAWPQCVTPLEHSALINRAKVHGSPAPSRSYREWSSYHCSDHRYGHHYGRA